ncbi:hypothetical protein ALQ95_02547 [Pseudomonas syringae pv. ribicola]|uniref:Uncharacterized protein n=1 Tax=Pseudomonas syringae pv. ribicola TaxID=55398 RepID=A0A3M2VXA7_PSESI|nr:hypothetical protein ALQ95_02547 [Pseudomonas syringae pv. ribicola]
MEPVLGEPDAATLHGKRLDGIVTLHLPLPTGSDRQRIAIDNVTVQLRAILQRYIQGAGVIGDEVAVEGTVVDVEVGSAIVQNLKKHAIAGKQNGVVLDINIRNMARTLTPLHPYGSSCQCFDGRIINAQLTVIKLCSTATYEAGMSEPDPMRQARYVALGRNISASAKDANAPASMSIDFTMQRADFRVADLNQCALANSDASPKTVNNTVLQCCDCAAVHHECHCIVIYNFGVLDQESSVTAR